MVFVGICLLPVIYVVFTARAKEAMYPTINQLVSIEGLLHADLGVALTLDMLDIVIMFRDAYGQSKKKERKSEKESEKEKKEERREGER